uniref:Uncharacterized protein n=1 Tax=Arundo donax TaxID=35708 RepID=A0A0A9C4F5_ARUDO
MLVESCKRHPEEDTGNSIGLDQGEKSLPGPQLE